MPRKEHRISQDTGIEEKQCTCCDTWKPLEAFSKNKRKWDHLRECCRTCANAKSKKRHRELRATEEGRKRIRAHNRKADKKRQMNGKRNAYMRKRRKNDPAYRLRGNLSHSIYKGLKRQGVNRKPGRTKEFLGCSYAELMDHLESLFQPGMTRENYGSVWHVDHIVPRAAFGGTREELMIVNWYKNLQPMWVSENLKKGAKYEDEEKIALIERACRCRR